MKKNKKNQKKGEALWGGRFLEETSRLMRDFSQSVLFDARLYEHDIRGSIAHARMLKKIGVLNAKELRAIEKGLAEIRAEIVAGDFCWSLDREDVHMNIEAELILRTPHGAKLHTGRSRNDQVATDVRLWMKEEIVAGQALLRGVQRALLDWAYRDGTVLLPGYTHMQRAQPVCLAHHLLAYIEMLDRDMGRLQDCFERVNVCPLGSGAIAGSTLPLDRAFVAKELGFIDRNGRPRITANSMDAVSDRDFIVEYLSAAALVAVHLSRMAEDYILWSSAEFNFIRIGDAFTTGSSLMPQKKNPDAAELVRGKSGRVVGNLVGMLVLLKGLPMTYNRDLQEDKERLFDTADTLRGTLSVLAEMIQTIRVNRPACALAVSDPLLLATDLADALVRRGVPFRDAHHHVGKAVALAEQLGKPLTDLTDSEWESVGGGLSGVSDILNEPLEKRMDARKMYGAPNGNAVRAAMKYWTKRLKD